MIAKTVAEQDTANDEEYPDTVFNRYDTDKDGHFDYYESKDYI